MVSTNLEQAMQLGLIGLGGMGASRAQRVRKNGQTLELVEHRPQAMASP